MSEDQRLPSPPGPRPLTPTARTAEWPNKPPENSAPDVWAGEAAEVANGCWINGAFYQGIKLGTDDKTAADCRSKFNNIKWPVGYDPKIGYLE